MRIHGSDIMLQAAATVAFYATITYTIRRDQVHMMTMKPHGHARMGIRRGDLKPYVCASCRLCAMAAVVEDWLLSCNIQSIRVSLID